MTRWGRLAGWAGSMVGLGMIPLLLGWSHLPDPAATHWGLDGAPDARMPIWALPLLVVGVVAVGLFATSIFRVEGRPTAEAFALVGLLGGVGASLMTSLVYLNWDAASWSEAGGFSWPHLVGVLLAGAVGVLAGYRLGRRWYPPPASRVDHRPMAIDVADGESIAWLGGCSVRWPYVVLLPTSLLFLGLPDWFKLIGLAFVVLAFMFGSVYVSVDDAGLRVLLGGGVPAKRIALDRVKTARVIDLEPAAWGGWGYRVVPGGSAVVLRRGDAIEVTFHNDRRFAVTVDDAATGAALLNGLAMREARRA